MLATRLTIAREVRDHFLSAEREQDAAALSAAKCIVAMLEGRQRAKLPVNTALEEIALVAKSAALAVEARQCLISAHAGMAELPRGIGIPERAWGDFDECPQNSAEPQSPADRHLRAVG